MKIIWELDTGNSHAARAKAEDDCQGEVRSAIDGDNGRSQLEQPRSLTAQNNLNDNKSDPTTSTRPSSSAARRSGPAFTKELSIYNLPLEIRLMIWKIALPGQRTLTATWKRSGRARWKLYFKQDEKQALLTQICVETRDFALGHGSFLFDPPRRGGFWWSSEDDTLLFDGSWAPSQAGEILATLQGLQNVHHIAMDQDVARYMYIDAQCGDAVLENGDWHCGDVMGLGSIGFWQQSLGEEHFIPRFFPNAQSFCVVKSPRPRHSDYVSFTLTNGDDNNDNATVAGRMGGLVRYIRDWSSMVESSSFDTAYRSRYDTRFAYEGKHNIFSSKRIRPGSTGGQAPDERNAVRFCFSHCDEGVRACDILARELVEIGFVLTGPDSN